MRPKNTKTDQLSSYLKTGRTAAAIAKRFGWEEHTARARVSGLAKAGHRVVGKGRPKTYRLAATVLLGLLAVAPDADAQRRHRQQNVIVVQQQHTYHAALPMTFGSQARDRFDGTIPPNNCTRRGDLEVLNPEPGEPQCVGGR